MITNTTIVRSVNGPDVTIIEGAEATGGGHGTDAVRGVYMSAGVLRGFTVTKGHTLAYGNGQYEESGGGINMSGANGSAVDCVLRGNSAAMYGGGSYAGTLRECTLEENSGGWHGGGSYGGTLQHCTLSSNTAEWSGGGNYGGTLENCRLEENTTTRYDGGGAANATLEGCVLVGNHANQRGGGSDGCTLRSCALWGNGSRLDGGGANATTLFNCTLAANTAGGEGGGACESALRNCIVYHNTAETAGDNYSGGTLDYSCTTPLPSGGVGNTTADPVLVGVGHIHAGSPCVGAGSSGATGTDVDGDPWSAPPAIGCDQPLAAFEGGIEVAVLAGQTNAAVGAELAFTGWVLGEAASNQWSFGDGGSLPNAVHDVRHSWAGEGDYDVVLTAYNDDNPGGVSATVGVRIAKSEYFVNVNNATPSAPFNSWATAATTIQDAVDAATPTPGSVVWVTNGLYNTGATVPPGRACATRVVITSEMTVCSVNGPEVTIIKGAPAAGGGLGTDAVRGVYMSDGLLCGFTVTNGHTMDRWGRDNQAGGIHMQDGDGAVSNCVVSGNWAYDHGGGTLGGTLIDCTVTGNRGEGWGGGSYDGTVIGCRLLGNYAGERGGGSCLSMLADCTLSNNTAVALGGGGFNCTLSNCVIVGNSADSGGGVALGELSHCTLRGNVAEEGGGSYSAVLRDCTLSWNTASNDLAHVAYGGGNDGGTLYNCTLESNSADEGGGTSGGTLHNCTLTGNSAARGGGSRGGELRGCALWGNTAAVEGGGSHGSILRNCTVVDNRATWSGGGSYECTLVNSIIYHNRTPAGVDNYVGGTPSHCCTLPMPAAGTGNIADVPMLLSGSHIHRDSACAGAGSAPEASGTDIDGESWATPPAIGCDEPMSPVTGPLEVRLEPERTDVAVGYAVGFLATVRGAPSASRWAFSDGTVLSNALYGVRHAWSAPGDYDVVLTAYNDDYPGGVAATTRVHVAGEAYYYVNVNNATPASPFTTWATAATTIQQAVDEATGAAGATVWVTNGEYNVGTHATPGHASHNRVVITNEITVRSVRGPAATLIRGAPAAGGTNGPGAVRGVYISAGVLSGFTVTDGHTLVAGDYDYDRSGGGVNMQGGSGRVTNCVLTGNSAAESGGGSLGGVLLGTTVSHNSARSGGGSRLGILKDCTLVGNSATNVGGGTYDGVLDRCTLTENSSGNDGGGSAYGTLRDCMLTRNVAEWFGGGVSHCTVVNCTLSGNSAAQGGGGSCAGTLTGCTLSGNSTAQYGGGSYDGLLLGCMLWRNTAGRSGGGSAQGQLQSCALTGNSARDKGGASHSSTLTGCTLAANSAAEGGGSYGGTLNNCIVYLNQGGGILDNYSKGTLLYCCTTPLPSGGMGNITNAPLLVSGSHIRAASPCVGAGWSDSAFGTDIDGEPWATPPAIGCDEPLAPFNSGLEVAIATEHTNVVAGFAAAFLAEIRGEPTSNAWTFGDGATAANAVYPSHAWSATGIYNVVLTAYDDDHPAGVSATTVVHVAAPAEYYVDISNASPNAPYTSWGTAANSIQDAVNEAAQSLGSIVWVSNGVYDAGFTVTPGFSCNNRVVVTNETTVRSVNGPELTIIDGGGAVRGLYMTAGVLSGFTITNGQTRISGENERDRSGGGVNMYGGSGRITNCVIGGNLADLEGGGCFGGRMSGCALAHNTAGGDGGGCHLSVLTGCTLAHNSADEGGGSSDCTLTRCTLSNNTAAAYGGGSRYGTLANCILSGNYARWAGGGAYRGTLYSCSILGNRSGGDGGGSCDADLHSCAVAGNSAATDGGGSDGGDLYNCTVSGNSAGGDGGGMYEGMPRNCIVYYNTAEGNGDNYIPDPLAERAPRYSCTLPMPVEGTGNITDAPHLLGGAHIHTSSPCVGAGFAAYASGADIDGQAWATPPAIGCDQPQPPFAGTLDVSIIPEDTVAAAGYPLGFAGVIGGVPDAVRWTFGDGMSASNETHVHHAWVSAGIYDVVLTAYNDDNPGGISATTSVQILPSDYYVAIDSPSPAAPYATWATAATNIQDAVDAAGAVSGSRVWVSNGVYGTGVRLTPGHTSSNRVVITNAITVCSVNGPAVTAIDGAGAVRGVYMSAGVLAGFTVSNGKPYGFGSGEYNRNGGGVNMYGGNGVVSNCVLTGNTASDGGGSFHGTLHDCTLTRNMAGSDGGGSCHGTLNRCTLSDNSADGNGGGGYYATLNNCLLLGNSADQDGGGSCYGTLRNCTLSHNSARRGGGSYYDDTVRNCIIYHNHATSSGTEYKGGLIDYCCTTPEPGFGTGNITNDPQFVDAAASNCQLRSTSPCIDRGNNADTPAGPDRDGVTRPLDGDSNGVAIVDMGAFEFIHELVDTDGDTMWDRWESEHGFDPTDPSDATGNRDGDPSSNRDEHTADTDPSDSNDYFCVISLQAAPSPTVHFRSSSNRVYILHGCADLLHGAWRNVPGTGPRAGIGGLDLMVDTNQPPVGPWYRPVVQGP